MYFIFRTLQFRYPHQYLKDLSDKHAELWIRFAQGQAPWPEYKYGSDGHEGVIMIADERDGWVERTQAEHEKISRLKFDRLERLWESWGANKGQSFLPVDWAALSPGVP